MVDGQVRGTPRGTSGELDRCTEYVVPAVGRGHTDPRTKKAKDEPIAEPIQPDPQPDENQAAHQPAEVLRQAKLLTKALRAAARERSRAVKQQKRAAKAAERAAQHDHIVEAPRAPKRSLSQRHRRDASNASTTSARRRIASLLGVLLGALGLACSIVLALGALLVVQGVDETGLFHESIFGACDALVGPLRDHITFSGSNAEMKEALVAWGAGSIIYLLIGLVAQALLTPGTDD